MEVLFERKGMERRWCGTEMRAVRLGNAWRLVVVNVYRSVIVGEKKWLARPQFHDIQESSRALTHPARKQ